MRPLLVAALAALVGLGAVSPHPAVAQGGDSAVLLGGGDEVYIIGMPAGWT